MHYYISFILFAVFCAVIAKQYSTPVVYMHGLGGNEKSGALYEALLKKYHPGQPFYSLSVNNGQQSYKSLYEQIEDIKVVIQTLIDRYPKQFANGFHLVGHSQGGLLTRCVIEESDNFKVLNYVSLAGVQAGEYGLCERFGKSFGETDCRKLTTVLYSNRYRNSTSVAQFWRSPNPSIYRNGNVFLPVMNNMAHANERRKKNILRLKHMYLFGSESDGVIVPWQSSHMGFYDSDGKSIVPLEKQEYYVQDTIGLRTLKESNRLSIITVPNITHNEWMYKLDLIVKHVLPCFED